MSLILSFLFLAQIIPFGFIPAKFKSVSDNFILADSIYYNDVLIITNEASFNSTAITNYFSTSRGIPSYHICSIISDSSDQIDSLTFEGIKTTIKNFILVNNLLDTINYIVTTHGVPLKIIGGTMYSLFSDAASFDSELALICSEDSIYIGKGESIANPYFGEISTDFNKVSFKNMFLVTRLTGYTLNDVYSLIDNSTIEFIPTSNFIFDNAPYKSSTLVTNMTNANNSLLGKGYYTIYDNTDTFLVEKTNVAGYVSWGSNDSNWYKYTQKAQPHFEWAPRAIAETYVSSSGRSFSDSTYNDPYTGWQSTVAELIQEGLCGVSGYVYEPYTSGIINVNYLFTAWGNKKTLAESYYAGLPSLSWMAVIVGDPKLRLNIKY